MFVYTPLLYASWILLSITFGLNSFYWQVLRIASDKKSSHTICYLFGSTAHHAAHREGAQCT